MLEVAGKQIADTLEEIISSKRSALLLWDLEYAIAPNAFNYAEIAPRLKAISDHARETGVPVFYSQQMHYDLKTEEAEVWARVRAKRSGGGGDVKIPAGKKVHDIVEELAPQPGDVVFQKRRPDGFIGTDLDLMLRHRGIKTILIGGVATEGGRRRHRTQRAQSRLLHRGRARLRRFQKPGISRSRLEADARRLF